MDKENKIYSIEIGGRDLVLEFPGYAEQANSSVLAKYGDTVVHVAVVMSKHEQDGLDYFPLTVDYEEKFYAAGKILGSRFVRREGRPSDEAILSARLIDRALRPLFNQKMRRDVQVTTTVLSFDEENDPDEIALIAASAALVQSDIPFKGPVAGLKIARIGNELSVNPKMSLLKNGEHQFEIFTSGTVDKINMVEMEGLDAKEEDLIAAFELAQKEINRLNKIQDEIREKIGKEKAEVYLAETDEVLRAAVKEFLKNKLEAAVYTTEKIDRQSKMNVLKHEMKEFLEGNKYDEKAVNSAEEFFEDEINNLIHEKVLKENKRPDGRATDELRALNSRVGLFERTHGSALFTRGNTRSLAITTLGPPSSHKLVETMESTEKKRFMLHYNFPKYSTGETGMSRGPGRREIGHGALAEKAVRRLIPTADIFPYTIRVVSEIMSSNGSSSMATVCGTVLSLMDAGVPIKKPAAGIAMGLMVNQKLEDKNQEIEYKVLTDIQGPEDHHGDMDFKVAGTADGVNAIQLDVKIDGLNTKMIKDTLEQARKARLQILDNMLAALKEPRKELSKYAPSIITIKIDPEKIGEVIGPGGKMINGIIERTGAIAIDIEEDGTVFITAPNQESGSMALEAVKSVVREFKAGDIVEGKVIKILDFGAIVDLGGGKDGMIHVSELKQGFVKKVEDVVRLGDFVRAKVINVENGKTGLSIKQLGSR
ncbi:MAG: polyribonucleotide nucleotidyltransferase [Candidatus Liptonbacteria bacterium]|nr:polyribonucleotide nucleotidyltransferase [Candidatus Liptonbacteria bacterium]